MSTETNGTRIGPKEVALGLIAVVVVLQLLRLLLYRKIDFLFVDDWVIFNNFSEVNHGINAINLDPYNGHSLIITRIIFIFVTKTLGIEISTFSIFLALCFAGTLVVLIWKTRLLVSGDKRLFLALSIVLISISLNQYQNFTMPICWSWIICLILIFWTYIISRQEITVTRATIILILSILGPLTLSFGFIIPGFVILKIIHELTFSKSTPGKMIYLITIIISTLFSYKIAIVNSMSDYGGFESPRVLLVEPLKATLFILASVGAPFTPASRYSTYIAPVFGMIVFVLLLKILREIKDFSALFMDESLLTMGILFHGIHLAGRFDGTWESIQIATQPRYSTGSIILLLGVVSYVIRTSTKRMEILLLILLGTLSISGMKTAVDFTATRHSASNQISNCLAKYGLTSAECAKLLYPGPRIISQVEFNEALVYLEKTRR